MTIPFLNDLNPQQLEIITSPPGPILVLAGAGSGKTRVLTYRFAYLIAQGVDPRKIIALTFTNKAAREMAKRIRDLTGISPHRLFISTFHSACASILRESSHRKNFTIYDTEDSIRVIKEVLKEKGLQEQYFNPDSLLSRFSRAKDRLISPDELKGLADGYYMDIVAELYHLYQDKLRKNNALDFGDLLFDAVKLLQQSRDILKKYQDRFRHILVDEYQDTNYAQFVFLKLLSENHKDIFVVGDEDQSIYGWRGADIRNIQNFEKEFAGTQVLRLERNYRSTQNILQGATELINNNKRRYKKTLWTKREKGRRVEHYLLGDEYKEAEFVIKKIVEMHDNEEMPYSSFAIFYRVNAQSRVIEETLRQYNIPYTIIGGINFYGRREVKDLLAYLRVIVNPQDSISLRRIINVPKRGIGQITMDRIEEFAKVEGISLYEALRDVKSLDFVQKRVAKRIEEFMAMLDSFSALKSSLSVSEVLERVIHETKFLDELHGEADRLENVQELINATIDFENYTGERSLIGFLYHTSLLTSDDIDTEPEKVSCLTLHSSKGLEFPCVFMVGMEEGLLPHRNCTTEEDIEEERRLCYVGMTRSKDRLILTSAHTRGLFGSSPRSLSGFIKEAKIPVFVIDDEAGSTPVAESDLSKGNRVFHKTFGYGRVLSRTGTGDDTQVKVLFDTGEVKDLLVKFAKLQKVK
jgi:DNA helicase-2/ATP-dependent DNA helicase PcrA